jgi:hypothetical protein
MIWGLLIPGWLKRAALWAVGGLVAALGIFMAGKRAGGQAAKSRALEADRKADRRMDHADVSRGDSGADIEWLRKRADK